MRGYAYLAFASLVFGSGYVNSEDLIPSELAKETLNAKLTVSAVEIEKCKQQSIIVSMYKSAAEAGRQDAFMDKVGADSPAYRHIAAEVAAGHPDGNPYKYLFECVAEIQKKIEAQKMK